MEPLPVGANFKRGKILWELGLHIAGNPETPYGGNRDMCIVVGSGAGADFKPWLRMSTGSAVMAHAVANGEIEAAFAQRSADGVAKAAHKLKSSARSVGANELADLCLALETAGKADNWARIEKSAPRLSGSLRAVADYVNSL